MPGIRARTGRKDYSGERTWPRHHIPDLAAGWPMPSRRTQPCNQTGRTSRMSGTKPMILLVEDDTGMQKQIKWSLDAYDVVTADDRESAIGMLRRHEPPVVLLDLGLPPDADGATEGLSTLQQILTMIPATKVIVITGNLDRGNAVKGMGMRASYF